MDYSVPQQPKARSLMLIILTSLSIVPFTLAIVIFTRYAFMTDFYPATMGLLLLCAFSLGKILSLIDKYILAFCRGVVKSKKIHYGFQLLGTIVNVLPLCGCFALIIYVKWDDAESETRFIMIGVILEQIAYISANVLAYMTINNAIEQGGAPVIQGVGIGGIDPAPFYPYNPQPYGQPQTQPPAHMIPYGQLIPGQHTPVVAKQENSN